MGWTYVGTIPGPGGSGGSGGWSDDYGFALELNLAETVALASDNYAVAIDASYAETNAALAEALQFATTYSDAAAAPSEARDSLIVRWATTTTTAGTAPTDAANATGSVNGTTAGVKAGGLVDGTSTLNLNIVAPMGEISSGSTRTFRAYYSVTAGATDTFTCQVSYRQIGQGANTVVTLPNTGNFLASGTTVSLTNIDPSVNVVATFTHAAATPTLGGSIAVDAVGIETTGAL